VKYSQIKNKINQELNEMKTDKVCGAQMIHQWQSDHTVSSSESVQIKAHRKEQRKLSSSILRYGSCVAAACLALVLGFTTISVASGKTNWNIWFSQTFSGKGVQENMQEENALEKQKDTVIEQNKSIPLGKYQLQVQEYSMDNNGFLYLLFTVKDDTGNDMSSNKLPITLCWTDGNQYYPIGNQNVTQACDIKNMKTDTTPYGYSVSAICPSLISPTNTLVFELNGSYGEFTGISVTEAGIYKPADDTLVSFSPYGFLMNHNSLLSGKIDRALNQDGNPTFIATYADGTTDKLQISNLAGMRDSDGYDGYLQFSPIFQYQKHNNQQTTWDEENYKNLLHSFTSYKFDVEQLTELTLDDGTVIFKK
jgi:hypothetical protein